jgi:hypothetical protein
MTNTELKSKVMTLGNKLAPRTGDRRAAFVHAWVIWNWPSKASPSGTGRKPIRLLDGDIRGARLTLAV